MSTRLGWKALTAALAGLAIGALPMCAQGIPQEGPVPTTALVMVQSKSGVPLDPAMLKLQVNKQVVPVTSVTPVAPRATQVAILIDDGLRFSFANQLNDFADFVNQLPAGTQVLVGYMQNGIVRGMHGFTANHQAAAQEFRIPMSVAGIDGSPYFTLSEFVKHWPSNVPAARFVLMITNGIDPYNGRPSIMNQDSPYVQEAQEDAERAGVAVYSIYYGQSFPRGARGSFSGQSYLAQVGDATGAASFNIGTITPPSLTPYLNDFTRAVASTYMIRFEMNSARVRPDTLIHIKLSTSQPGVKLHTPDNVHPGIDLQ